MQRRSLSNQTLEDGWYYKGDFEDPSSIHGVVYIGRVKTGDSSELRAASNPANLLYGYPTKLAGGGFVWGPLPFPGT